MMLNFNNDRTYTKDVVLANVRYALFDSKSLRGDVISAYRIRYKIIDAVDMASLDIGLNEIMEAANENCKKVGYKIMSMDDAISEINGFALPCDTLYPMYVGTNPERI